MFREYIEFIELTDPTVQRMAAQWGDPSGADGRVWLDLADGKPVPAQDFIWAFRTTAEDHFDALLGKQPEWAEEEAQFLREQLELLRTAGETLLANVSQASLARYVASWFMTQPPSTEWRPSADDLLLPAFGDRTGIWRGRFAPVRLLVEQASPLLGREREEVVARLFALADRLHSEALVELEDPPAAWSPEGHKQAWAAAAHAVRGGRQVWVDASPDGLALVIAAGDGEPVSLPLRAGIDSAGYRRTPPDLRQTVAELTAIDAAISPHDEPHEWPTAVAARREELMVRLWRTVHGAAWYRWDTPAPVAGYDWDHRDPHRPLVLVVQLPDGPQIRAHVHAHAVDEWELADAPVMPWDGAPADYAERVEWLARRVDTR